MAVQSVLFISQNKLQTFTSIDPNINLTDIVPHIFEAQDLYLNDMLGSNFYGVLQQQIIAYTQSGSTASFSPNYQNLIDVYIAPIVYEATIYMALPWIAYKMKAKGVFSGAAEKEDYKSISLKEVTFLMEKAYTAMQFYCEQMRRQLNLYAYLYPDYVNFAFNQLFYPNRRQNYSQGIAIPRSGSKTMNQQYGRSLETQGMAYIDSVTGVDVGLEMYGPSAIPTA